MATTYGTIPSEPPESNDFLVRARDQIRSGLATRRPWRQMVQIQSFSFPSSLNVALERIRNNTAFFRMNYVIVILFLLFLTLLWHPISLVVFIVMMVAWLFLYFLRDEPVKFLGLVVDDRIVMMALWLATLAVLFLTDVTDNIIIGLSIGAAVVLIHGLLTSTDDLFFVDDEEGLGPPPLSRNADARPPPLPLKHAASSSYSIS